MAPDQHGIIFSKDLSPSGEMRSVGVYAMSMGCNQKDMFPGAVSPGERWPLVIELPISEQSSWAL